jgi:hypothetical protein
MSSSKKALSTQRGESSKSPLVLDFLYHDSRRVGSFLSQFDSGHLTQLTRTHEASEATSESASREFGLGLTPIVGGKSNSAENTGVAKKDGLQSVFDPYWTNARALLNYLNEHGFIERDIATAKMGQFVLISGKIIPLDMQSLKPVWSLPSIKRKIIAGESGDDASAGNRAARRASGKGKLDNTENELAAEVLPHLPHSPQMHIIGNEFAAWCSLQPESLIGTMTDLVLKHGAHIAGTWSILGILDAQPDDDEDAFTQSELVTLAIAITPALVAKMALDFAPITRQQLGRPEHSYGITPLLIFRAVGD